MKKPKPMDRYQVSFAQEAFIDLFARCGNAVCPPMARAMVQANLPEYCIGIDIRTLAQFHKMVAI